MSDHGPVEAAVEKQMLNLADIIKDRLPNGYGFVLLTFGLNTDEGRMNYISNAMRDDMLVALKELVANFEGRLHKPRGKQ